MDNIKIYTRQTVILITRNWKIIAYIMLVAGTIGLVFVMNRSQIMLLAFIVALCIKPLRQAFGLLLVIFGFIECLTIIGIIIGVPAILIGGIFLFAK